MVYDRLIGTGFLKGYDVWINHGEEIPSPVQTNVDMEDQEDSHRPFLKK